MLSFRDGDGRGAEDIIADERIPKATSFGEKAMTETLKTSKSWTENQTKSEPQLCFILRSHSPVRSLLFSPRCVELSKALPGSTWSTPHDLGVSETPSIPKHFLLTFRDTSETKKCPKQSKVTAAHCPNVPPAAPVARQRWQSQTWPAAGSGSPRST